MERIESILISLNFLIINSKLGIYKSLTIKKWIFEEIFKEIAPIEIIYRIIIDNELLRINFGSNLKNRGINHRVVVKSN